MKLSNTECSQTSAKLMQNITRIRLCVAKIKGEWVKQHCLGKYEHFGDFSWPRNEGRPWKESLPGTFKLIFSMNTGVVASPVMFLLYAFTIKQLSDYNTEQGKNFVLSADT